MVICSCKATGEQVTKSTGPTHKQAYRDLRLKTWNISRIAITKIRIQTSVIHCVWRFSRKVVRVWPLRCLYKWYLSSIICFKIWSFCVFSRYRKNGSRRMFFFSLVSSESVQAQNTTLGPVFLISCWGPVFRVL